MKTLTKEMQNAITPSMALNLLKEGNKRFVNNLKVNRNLLQQANETSDGQHPFAVILSCIDSRTSAELIFDQGLGDVFSIRIAGNIINEDILGSMEYACNVAGSKLIMVLGHTRCGAIKGACEQVEMGNLTPLLQKISPAIEITGENGMEKSNHLYTEKVAYNNVLFSMEQILEKSSIISGLYEEGRIGIVGGIFSLENGKVHFIKEMFNKEEKMFFENEQFLMQ